MSSSAPTPAATSSPLSSLDAPFPLPLPRNCTESAMMSTAWRLLPSWASHSRHSRRPSIATGRPFERYRATFSPWAPHTVTLKKLGLSTHSSPSLRRVLQAIRRLHTDVPLGVERSSGSAVRLPVMTTRLMLFIASPPVWWLVVLVTPPKKDADRRAEPEPVRAQGSPRQGAEALVRRCPKWGKTRRADNQRGLLEQPVASPSLK